MLRLKRKVAAVLAAAALASCSQFSAPPVTPPSSAEQVVAYGYAQLASSYNLLSDLASRQRIGYADASRTLRQLDEIKLALDAASTAGDTKSVSSITQGLVAIETALKARASQ